MHELPLRNPRTTSFKRNTDLESLLAEINGALACAETQLLPKQPSRWPLIFVVGPLRSGTTLMMQWLSSTGLAHVPTNLLSRFYAAPILGAKIQLLLTDPRYRFRDELSDLAQPANFESSNGKTRGALSPNEFWYFWRRFIPHDEMAYLDTKQLLARIDVKLLASELTGLAQTFESPFATKAMLLNYRLDLLDKLFEKAIFLYVHRNPLANIASILEARRRQYGTEEAWYSFRIPEFEQLEKLAPAEQAAGQVLCINRAIRCGLASIADHKQITVAYEDFCANPEGIYHHLRRLIKAHGHEIAAEYQGPSSFSMTRISSPLAEHQEAWTRVGNIFRDHI